MRRRLSPVIALAIATGTIAVGATGLDRSAGAAATTIYVSPSGNDGNGGGSASDALRTVREAVRIAPPDATILIADGRYHETVQVFDKTVHLRALGANVVFDGATTITNWTRESGTNRWYTTGWTAQFPRSDGVFVDAAHPEAAAADQLYVDGAAQRQVLSRAAVTPGTFFHDEAADRLYIGSDPTGRTVEASDLAWALYLNRADGSTVRGITFRRYATPSRDLAAVRAFGDNITLTDVTVRDNAFNGISIIGERVAVIDSVVRSNGHTGIHGHLSSFVTVRASTIFDNNAARFDNKHAAGGLKFTNSDNLVFERNTIRDNNGPGLWTDISSHDIDVVSNRLENNVRAGVELELSGRIEVIDNIVRGNGEAGIYVLESNDVRVWHNLATDNARDIWALQGPRSSGGLPSGVLWDLRNVSIRANAVGGSGRGEEALLAADDWTENQSAASLNVTTDSNSIWMPPSSTATHALRWAMWPQQLAWTSNLTEFRNRTGQALSSRLVTNASNPFEQGDAVFTPLAAGPNGPVLPSDLAQLAGVASGVRYPAGPISPAWTQVITADGIDQGASSGSTARRSGVQTPVAP